MFNPYIIILGLFAIAGLATAIWAWQRISNGNKTLGWQNTEGVIEQANTPSHGDILIPKILVRYTIAGQTYRHQVETPGMSDATPELAKRYLEDYPEGATTHVYYDPEQPDRATLKPGPRKEDWLVFIVGIGAMIAGILFLL